MQRFTTLSLQHIANLSVNYELQLHLQLVAAFQLPVIAVVRLKLSQSTE